MRTLEELIGHQKIVIFPEADCQEISKHIPMLPLNATKQKMRVGIEIEIEGITNGANFLRGPRGKSIWNSTVDNSLRNNGVEYVTCGAIISKYVPLALSQFYAGVLAMNPKYSFSDRTSVHVHVDMRKSSIMTIISNIIVYMCFEKLFFEMISRHGIDRSKNVFCVTLNDSRTLLALQELMSHWVIPEEDKKENLYREMLANLVNSWNKYSALNIVPLYTLNQGTIEYRQMHGTDDMEFVNDWINMLLSIKEFCMKRKNHLIAKYILDLNSSSRFDQFIRDVVGDFYFFKYFANMDTKGLMEYSVETIKSAILLNMQAGAGYNNYIARR